MKKDEVEVGGTYLAKVGARSVEVRIDGENGKGGWNARSVASGKPVRIKNPQHLRPAKAADAAVGGTDAGGEDTGVAAGDGTADTTGDGRVAPGDDADLVPLTKIDKAKRVAGRTKGRGPAVTKAAKAPSAPEPAKEKAAPKDKAAKGMSCLDAAAAVLKAAGGPMRCKEMVAAMKAKGLWQTDAPTPAATLSSALLREITTKGASSRFNKADRGLFALAGD